MRWPRIALVVALVVAASAQIAPTRVDAKLAATLTLTGFDDLVLDEAGHHIFLSQGLGQDGVVVTDLAGTPVATITNMPSARRMALSYDGTKVYVPLYSAHQIAVVSTSTLAVVDRYDLSIDVCPSSVAPTANGLLAVGSGCPGNGFGGIGVLNLATRVYNSAPGVGPFYSPVVAASAGSGALFVASDLGLSPTTLYVYSSAGGTPTQLTSRFLLDTGNLGSFAVNPAGTRVVVAGGSPYVHRSYSLPDLADATDYISTNYPVAVAWSADGSTVVTGTSSSLGPDLRFNDAATGAIRRQVIVGEPLLPNSVEVSSDGRTAYAITYGGPVFHFSLNVIGPNVEGALFLNPPASTYVGQSVNFLGALTFDNIGFGNVTVNVERSVGGSPFAPIGSATTQSDGRFSVSDVPTQVGQTSYRVTSVAAPGFPSQTQTTTVDVLPLPPGAMSLSAPATATVGQLLDVTGTLTFGGLAINGLQVTIQRVWNGVVTTVGVAFTGQDGFHIQDLPLNVGATTYIATSLRSGPFTSQSASTSVQVVAGNDPVPPVVVPAGAFPLDPPLPPDAPTLFSPLVPARLLDTRAGTSTIDGLGRPGRPLDQAGTMNLQVLGRGGVPSSGVSAVVLNVTVASPSTPSFLTIWPSGTGRPSASNLNFVAGQTVPNLVVAKVGVAGNVSIFNLSGSVDVIADVAGYFPDGDGFVPLVPARLLETRPDLPTIDGLGRPGAPLGPSQSIDVQVVNRGGVPASGVDSVVLNVTATNPTANSYVTVWPTGQQRPVASNLNTVPGQTVPNLVVAKVGASGNVSIYNLAGSVDVVVDIAGYFPVGGSFVSLQPARLMETRPGETVAPGATNKGTPLGAGQTFDLVVAGIGGVPASRVSAVVLNVTAIHPSGPSFVTVWPTGVPRPNASNLNLTGGGQVVPNLVVARVGAGGKVSIFNLSGNTDLIVDVAGYFVEEPVPLRDIVSNETSTCTLDWLGRSECWGGTGFDPESVYPTTSAPPGFAHSRLTPYSLSTYSDAVDLAIGDQHACMLRADLTVWCWTTSVNHPLIGDGAVGSRWPPVQVPGLTNVVDIDASTAYTCALRSDGVVLCWGEVPGAPMPYPTVIQGISQAVQISTGPYSACALQSNGQVVCWGIQGATGVLGTINGADSPAVAHPVAGVVDADSVKVQGLQACATRQTGGAVCWGNGFLGGGSTGQSLTGVQVIDGSTGQPATDIYQVEGGTDFRCALRFDDNVYCWGSSFNGARGLAPSAVISTTSISTAVPGLPPIALITANAGHMCGVSYTSDVYCWGDNSHGQIGDGTVLTRPTPTLVYSAFV